MSVSNMEKSESGLRIRVSDRLRQDFIAACRAGDQTAARVIRSFMRKFVETKAPVRQEDLFLEKKSDTWK